MSVQMQLSAQKEEIEVSGYNGLSRPLAMFSIVANELEQVKALIKREMSDSNEHVQKLVTCINTGKGKMIRAGMVLLSGLACGGMTEKHVRAAAVVEMIHEATLLHDDVVDDGKNRRGVPTINNLHGNESAVLLGDFLLCRVLRLCMGLDKKAAETIASASVSTCEGELREITQSSNLGLSETEYIDIVAQKTASLFSGACKLGAILAQADERHVKMLADYGHNTGIAFQITDDLLDIVGDENKIGKSVGNDLKNNKLTLPVIHLLKTASKADKDIIQKILIPVSSLSKGRRKIQDNGLAAKLRSAGSIEYAMKKADDFAERAIAEIKELDSSEAKKALIEISRFSAKRAV